MKISDVKIGGTYETKIGSEIVRVRVLAERKPLPYADTVTRSYGSRPTRFLVARTDNGRTLPKTRTAASLRPCEARFCGFTRYPHNRRDPIMGDRAIVHFYAPKDGAELSPAVYLHWSGSDVQSLLRETFELMRTRGADLSYTTARFIGICHTKLDGNLSLGVWNAPADGLKAARDPSYSHGDAGVFIVHLTSHGWEIEMHGGYGFHPNIPARDLQRPRVLWAWKDPAPDAPGLASGARALQEGR